MCPAPGPTGRWVRAAWAAGFDGGGARGRPALCAAGTSVDTSSGRAAGQASREVGLRVKVRSQVRGPAGECWRLGWDVLTSERGHCQRLLIVRIHPTGACSRWKEEVQDTPERNVGVWAPRPGPLIHHLVTFQSEHLERPPRHLTSFP